MLVSSLFQPCALYGMILLAVLPQAGNEGLMSQPDKVDRFKQRVGFEENVKDESPEDYVHVQWPSPQRAPGLDGDKWKLVSEGVRSEAGGAVKKWTLTREMEQVVVTVFVSSKGPELAQQFLVTRATENMMIDSPFVKSPVALGTLAVSLSVNADVPMELLWTYRNVCFDVRVDNSQLNPIPLAKWLQQLAKEGTRKSRENSDSLGKVRATKALCQVGESFEIVTEDAGKDAESHLLLKMDYDLEQIELVESDGLRAELKPLKSGPAFIEVTLVDTRTLVSESSSIRVEGR